MLSLAVVAIWVLALDGVLCTPSKTQNPTKAIAPRVTAAPLQSNGTCGPSNCTWFADQPGFLYWATQIPSTTVTHATVLTIVQRNHTTSTTIYNTDLGNHTLPTDTNSDGTKTYAFTVFDYKLNRNVTTVVAYPSNTFVYNDRYSWEGTLATTTDGHVACITHASSTTQLFPSHPLITIAPEDQMPDPDPRGWLVSADVQGCYGFGWYSTLKDSFPNVGALHTCQLQNEACAAPAVAGSTALFTTVHSTTHLLGEPTTPVHPQPTSNVRPKPQNRIALSTNSVAPSSPATSGQSSGADRGNANANSSSKPTNAPAPASGNGENNSQPSTTKPQSQPVSRPAAAPQTVLTSVPIGPTMLPVQITQDFPPTLQQGQGSGQGQGSSQGSNQGQPQGQNVAAAPAPAPSAQTQPQPQSQPAAIVGTQTIHLGSTVQIHGTPVAFVAPSPSSSSGNDNGNDNANANGNGNRNAAPHLIVGSSTMSLPTAAPAVEAQPALVVGTSTSFLSFAGPGSGSSSSSGSGATSAAEVITIAGQTLTLTPNLVTTIAGTPISLAAAITAPPALTVGGETISADSSGAYVIAGQTVVPGGKAVTVGGTVVSLKSGGGVAVVGGVTETLVASGASSGAGGSASGNAGGSGGGNASGMGGYVWSALGGSDVGSASATSTSMGAGAGAGVSASGSAQPTMYTGAAAGGRMAEGPRGLVGAAVVVAAVVAVVQMGFLGML